MSALGDYLSKDHERLEGLLGRATEAPDAIAPAPWEEFRGGILRHIAIEEKILMPALRAACPPQIAALWPQLRIEHGAIAALLVPPPDHALVAELRSILKPHNVREEEPGGLYALCDRLASDAAAQALERARGYPPVKTLPPRDVPYAYRKAADALAAMRKQLERAGRV